MTDKEFTSEKQLILALRRGDQDAFRYVIKSYQQSIIRVCKRFAGNHEDAEDLAQDVFIQLYKSASGFRGNARLSTWLYRVAVNKSLNHIRSGKIRKTKDHNEFDSHALANSGDNADDNINAVDHKNALDQALNKLPENQRTAFILQKYEDMSYEEISKVMDQSLSSVQSLIFRARKNLQDNLKEYFEKNIK